MELRDYQKELINKIRSEIIKEKKTICAVLGCGGGKSVIQGMIAKSATQKKNEVLFIVHRKELCQQIENTFRTCGVDFTYCTVGMVQTLCRRVPKLKEPKLILVDECHHILSNSYRMIIDSFPQAVVVGFTATPVRMNEGGLGAVFESLVESVSTKWLIEHHYLAPYKYYGVELADTRHLHTKNGEFIPDEVELYLLFKTDDIKREIVAAHESPDTITKYLESKPEIFEPQKLGQGWEITLLIYDETGKSNLTPIKKYIKELKKCKLDDIHEGAYYNIVYQNKDVNSSNRLVRTRRLLKTKCIKACSPEFIFTYHKDNELHLHYNDIIVITRCRDNEDSDDVDRFIYYSHLYQWRIEHEQEKPITSVVETIQEVYKEIFEE